MIKVAPVILSGGSGTRLWPLSRSGFPKQFLSFDESSTLFQKAVQRLDGLVSDAFSVCDPLVVSSDDHRFIVLEQLREISQGASSIVLEPVSRNTAPALTLAALTFADTGEDPVMVVLPADQEVQDGKEFLNAVETAVVKANAGNIVIFGVPPTSPETGFGYVKTKAIDINQMSAAVVERFEEKPSHRVAQQYLLEGGYFWNAGIFVVKASVWLKAIAKFRLDILEPVRESWFSRNDDGPFVRPNHAAFSHVPNDSIDYAVMEKCPTEDFPVSLVKLDAGWSDLGSWGAIQDVVPKDASGNGSLGDVVLSKCENSFAYADSRLLCLSGVANLIVVETADAVLVTSRAEAQNVKAIVENLHAQSREEASVHKKVQRPWGWYDCIDQGPRFKVKRIQVKVDASLSLQKHAHRAEHWVVVKGVAEVTCGVETFVLNENESTYIPVGETHRLRNIGSEELEIIEVQSGAYLGEDDIERLEDKYGRTQ